jgi:hypothetical protein
MRPLVTIAGISLLALAAGCTSSRWGFINRPKDQPVQGEPPTKEAIVAYLNDNASRIQSFRSDDLSMTVHAGAIPVTLSGNLMTQKARDATQKPRDFRMSGNLAASRMVDLGSNSDEFWWWISKDKPPDQYYCSYRDLQEGRVRALPFPIQPEWIMETLGLGPYGPAEKYEMDYDDYNLKLIERTRTPLGQAVRKVVVMKRAPQDVKRGNPQVAEYLLLDDATGKELCSAQITQVQVGNNGAVLPRRLELRCAIGSEKVRLDMRFEGVSINAPLPPTAFVRQPMQGVRSVDLARMFGNPAVQSAQSSGQ